MTRTPANDTFDPAHRARTWTQLQRDDLDVLVIGGGVTGAGVALDAVTRGLKTALVEMSDLASGTSSRSSKLFHGGLRYLEQLNFGLVREALHERELMLTRLAPHLVRPVLVPLPAAARGWERGYVGAGLALYDTIAGREQPPAPPAPHQDRRPGPGARRCAATHWSAHCCTTTPRPTTRRHTLTVARTAAHYGARCAARPRSSACCATPGGSSERQLLDVETGQQADGAPRGPSSTPPVCGPTTCRSSAGDPRAGSTSGHPKASTWSSHATGSTSETGLILRTTYVGAVRHPVGATSGSSAPPTPTGTWTRPTRPPPAPTSTTC